LYYPCFSKQAAVSSWKRWERFLFKFTSCMA